MLLTLTVAAALAAQLGALVLAARVARASGWRFGWTILAAVAGLMLGRRALVLVHLLRSAGTYPADWLGEADALLASLLMAAGLWLIANHLQQMQHSAEVLRQRSDDLAGRVRELNCLYSLSTLIEQEDRNTERIFERVPALLITTLALPEGANVRLTVGEQAFSAGAAGGAEPVSRFDLTAGSDVLGVLDVGWPAAPVAGPERRWTDQEQRLLRAVAERLGRVIQRGRTESERVALQEQLHQAQKMEAVGRLGAGLAHDFGNLLAVVRGHAERAAEGAATDSPAREHLTVILGAAAQGTDLVRSLLTFSRDAGEARAPLDLAALVAETGRLLRHTVSSSIRLIIEPKPTEEVWVHGDRTQLQQALLNLALNAADAMPTGGQLRLSVTAGEGPAANRVARLIVSDTGTGMPPDVRARVFEPFFTTKPRGIGTGLGLPVVHGIVRDHGGSIALDSAPGRGTTFTIELPRQPRTTAPAPEPAAPPAAGARGRQVLIVQQNRHVRGVLAATLESCGFRVFQTADPAGAADVINRRAADLELLILDGDGGAARFPDGVAAARAAGFAGPVLVMTRDPAGVRAATGVGVHILGKPFDMVQLSRAAGALLAAPREERAVT